MGLRSFLTLPLLVSVFVGLSASLSSTPFIDYEAHCLPREPCPKQYQSSYHLFFLPTAKPFPTTPPPSHSYPRAPTRLSTPGHSLRDFSAGSIGEGRRRGHKPSSITRIPWPPRDNIYEEVAHGDPEASHDAFYLRRAPFIPRAFTCTHAPRPRRAQLARCTKSPAYKGQLEL